MIRKAKSIEKIYEECKDFDLVITNDAPLATALNKLITEPRLGYLAMTPKQIASKFAQLHFDVFYEKHEVVIKISRMKKISLKSIHQTMKKIYEMWMYNARLEFVAQYLSEEEQLLLNLISEFTTIETAMENFNENFYADKKIAVVGEELFSLLDLEVLPRKSTPAKRIDVFEEGEYEIERTYLFPSAEDLIRQIVALINVENADETAIVLNRESEYLEILKSRLRESGIPIEIKNYLSEELSVRNFLSLIETSFRVNDLKVNEFVTTAALFGIELNVKYGNYDFVNYLKHFSKDNYLNKLYSTCLAVREFTYKEFLELLKKDFFYKVHDELSEVINLLEFENAKINEDNLLELKYFIREFDSELESGRSGVLFVNSSGSSFIDRQQVFFIGLDNSWMKLFPDKDYLNKEEEDEKSISRFQLLLQQGSVRFYFARDVINYKTVIPCYYFFVLSEKNLTGFSDGYFNPLKVITEHVKKPEVIRKVKLPTEEIKKIEYISPTSLNTLFKCPKLYSFQKLLPSEDIPVFKKGTLLHEFAELYFHHPEFVKENLDKVVDLMANELSLFLINPNILFLKNEILLGAESVIAFLDEKKFNKDSIEDTEEPVKNSLMQKFGLKKIFGNTEKQLDENEITGISGKIDLQSGNNIVDYKTSRVRRTEYDATVQSNVDHINIFENVEFDFQAASYIAALRHKFPEIIFIYDFLYNNYKNQIDPQRKQEKILTHIKYLPATFLGYLCSRTFFEEIKSRLKKRNDEARKAKISLLEKFSYENYVSLIEMLEMDSKDFFNKEKLTDKFREVSIKKLNELDIGFSIFGKQKQNTMYDDVIDPVASMIYKLRVGEDSSGYAFKDDIDKFKVLVDEMLKELNEYVRNVFPYKPVFGSRDICKKCDYLNLCIGNKLW